MMGLVISSWELWWLEFAKLDLDTFLIQEVAPKFDEVLRITRDLSLSEVSKFRCSTDLIIARRG